MPASLLCFFPLFAASLMLSCSSARQDSASAAPVPHPDTAFVQAFSVKYHHTGSAPLLRVAADRNGRVRVLGAEGLLGPHHGALQYPGRLEPDLGYRAMDQMELRDLARYRGQFVYLTDRAVLSNGWAGSMYVAHGLPEATMLRLGPDSSMLVSDGRTIVCLEGQQERWRETAPGPILDLQFGPTGTTCWVLSPKGLFLRAPDVQGLQPVYEGQDLQAFAWLHDSLYLADRQGYFAFEGEKALTPSPRRTRLPAVPITCMAALDGSLWFGSSRGAYMRREDGTFDYYSGRRWLPGEQVLNIAEGPDRSVLVLTPEGLAQIKFEPMTLAEKAAFFERQVRQRHIRYGFNATWAGMEAGVLATGRLVDSDNDGLWTGMYLASQAFRHAVTRSPDALRNCRESLLAMQRLFSINPVRGFPARSFERRGHIAQLADPERWQHAPDPNWDWKATTSSDEAIGHIFAYSVVAEVVDDEALAATAIALIDSLMTHILDHDLYLVDYDGQPTTWGRWNPAYVNARPPMVGDRKLNSSNIIGMLQTAYHFTGKEKYRTVAFELMDEHGYLDNLMRPMREIGPAPDTADDWSRMLSSSWNHSDDEMYFLGYWGLYRYAFNDSLKAMYREAILDHWAIERPEKEGAWNILTAITGATVVDLDAAIWYLQEYPLDLIAWDVQNSHRRDLTFVEPNFRGQTISEVLPPDERPIRRHNANTFQLDQVGRDGTREYSAGDIWLLPYWMGRYLGVIRPPQTAE